MKTIMLLGAGIEQVTAIQIAKEMGLRVIVVDQNPKAPGLKIADVGINADIKDVDKLIEIGKKYKIDGVMTHGVEIPVVVAKVARALNLPGIDPEIAERATNKLKRIQCFKKNNVPTSRFFSASSIEEAKIVAENLGFPVVFKPIDNSGARGVVKISSIADIEKYYKYSLSFSKQKTILVEEYLQGFEISTESVIYNDKIYTPCIADRNYSDKKSFDPFFIEDGGELPTRLSKEELDKVLHVVEKAIKALGLTWGVAKGDILIDSEGPKVIEMAARTSGGRFCSLKVPLSNGANILYPLIEMAVNIEPNLDWLVPKFTKGVAERFIFPDPGKIVSISGISEARKIEGVYELTIDDVIKVGNIVPRIENHTDRHGYVVAIGKTREQAIKIAEKVIKKIKIEVERV
ncbi:MAG: ATP-grasp domain-containing protein [Thermoplasmata archaeon]